jgi:hypothetical protein
VPYEREEIDCRLWQDPIGAVRAASGPRDWEKNRLIDVYKEIEESISGRDGNTEKVQVLLVMVRSGDSAEDYEDRLRSRQAALAALRRCRLRPERDDCIHYFAVDSHTMRDPGGEGRITDLTDSRVLIVPYEWFKPDELQPAGRTEVVPKRVLILWLQDEYFTRNPLRGLRRLTGRLRPGYSTDEAERKRLQIDVIGPTESTTLRKMLEEEITDEPNDPNIGMYSPMSTAAPDILTHNLPNAPKDRSIRSILKNKGFDFIRTIGTDAHLADCLIRELERRGVDLKHCGVRVALVCEWDSFYGRVFPFTFSLMRNQYTRNDEGWKTNGLADHLHEVLEDRDVLADVFYYVGGIDGKLPARNLPEQSQSVERSQKPQAQRQPTFTEAPEFPAGRSQVDYVRRLARNLADKYEGPKGPGKKKFRAIGIIGSDVYDKLLLLQALREEFSDVIFFTTDLDARLMHHPNFKWTRNLIVASNYGLALNEHYQPLTLRFRDNYQTSQYLACLMALGFSARSKKLLRELPEGTLESAFGSPRLFEIGRDCAVNLTGKSETSAEELNLHPTVPKTAAHRDRARGYLLGIGVAAGIVLLLLVYFGQNIWKVMTAFFSMKKARSKRERYIALTKRIILGALVMGSVLSVTLFIYTVYNNHFWWEGEPFSFAKGVSIWPGEALRLAAGILSLIFIIKSLYDLSVNEEDIKDELLNESSEGEERSGKGCEMLARWYAENVSIFFWRVSGRIKAEELWRQYVRRGRLHHRLVRIIPALLLYLALGITLMFTFGFPNWPGRGHPSLVVDRILLVLAVPSMLLLMFFVVDATQLCARFIKILKEPTNWSGTNIMKRLEKAEREELKKSQPKETQNEQMKQELERRLESMREDFDEWLDIKLIAHRTEAVGKLIYYPFIILLIMLVARSPLFDNWNWPIGLILVLAIYATFALYCAIRMRRSAENARTQAIARLQTNLVLVEIRSMKQGAFSPFSENPVIGAILIPSGGVTLLALWEMFGKF